MYGEQQQHLGQIPLPITLAAQASEAYEYIKAKLTEFRALGPKLGKMQQQTAHVINAARAVGDTKTEAEGRNLLAELGRLKVEWTGEMDKLRGLDIPGLGAIPLAAILLASAGAIIALAASIALLFRKSTASERTLDALAAGVLSPQEAEALERARAPGFFGGLADTAKWIALAIGGALLIPIIAKRGGGSMTWR